jgi:gas vesicle protein
MFDREESDGGGSFAAGLLVGALVGAGLALLFAPEKGETMRRKLGKKARRVSESAREVVEDAAEEVRDEVARRRREIARNLGV